MRLACMFLSPNLDNIIRSWLAAASLKLCGNAKCCVGIVNQTVAIRRDVLGHVIAGKWRTLEAAAITPTDSIVAEPLEGTGQWLDMKWWNRKGTLLSLHKLDWKHLVGVKVKLSSRSL
jgi:hypothetical protein